MNLTNVEVIEKTRFLEGSSLVTFIATYPDIIHAEAMTHRLFSRNASSSRAIPVKTLVGMVRSKTFVPWHWKKNRKGMQAGEGLPPATVERCRARWIEDAERAMESALFYDAEGVHKGIANRPLQPYMYKQTLFTARIEGLPHFFNLRADPDAEDHFLDLANMAEARIDAAPSLPGCRHLPFITEEERVTFPLHQALLVSAVRARRVSYFALPSVGDDGVLVYPKAPPAWADDLVAAEEMISAGVKHASPFEHQAVLIPGAFVPPWNAGNLALPGEVAVCFQQFRKTLEGEFMRARVRRL